MNDGSGTPIDLSHFAAIFLEEAREHHATLEHGLLQLERGERDPELLNTIFRAAHSIKGAAGTFGFTDVARFTHACETLLDRVRAGTMAVDADLTTDLFLAADALQRLIEAASDGTSMGASDVALMERLERRAAHFAPAAVSPVASAPADVPLAGDGAAGVRVVRVRIVPGDVLLRSGSDPLLLMRELGELGTVRSVRLDDGGLPSLDALVSDVCHLTWEMELATSAADAELRGVFLFVDDCCAVTIEEIEPAAGMVDVPSATVVAGSAAASEPKAVVQAAPAARARQDGGTIRVATDKIDALVDLVGELVIAQAMVAQLAEQSTGPRSEDLCESVGVLDRHLRDLQERVLGIRMLPIGSLFGRFDRVVRDTATAIGKPVRLATVGEDTELDKGVIEGLADPLTHLLRNAVDHGIETPDGRRAAGKAETGTITLSAAHEAGTVIVEICDDGGGLNFARIREKAESLGLLAPGVPASEEELAQLIFAPGFSTATKVSDLSGRGVGMDVVRRNVESLNGNVSIHSVVGRGTTFTIRLPLTLAILDGMQLRLDDQIFVLPLHSIMESFRYTAQTARSVLEAGNVVVVRGEAIPLFRLAHLIGRPALESSDGIVVVLESRKRRVALLVDELLGESQVVVKPLEAHFKRVEGLLGATILGDGRVALILDADALTRHGAQTTPEIAA